MNKVKVYRIAKKILHYYKGEKSLIGDSETAIIEAGENFILIDNDGCHQILKNHDNVRMGIANVKPGVISLFPDATIEPTVQWILDNVESYETTLPEWITYFKIKSRVIENCNLLKKTLKGNNLKPVEYLG